MKALRARGPAVTAVCAYNDESAMALLAALDELGLRAADDLAVIGVDDIPVARYAHPPLTTVMWCPRSSVATSQTPSPGHWLASRHPPRRLDRPRRGGAPVRLTPRQPLTGRQWALIVPQSAGGVARWTQRYDRWWSSKRRLVDHLDLLLQRCPSSERRRSLCSTCAQRP